MTDTFYHELKSMVNALASDYFPNPDDAEDAVQEVFLKLHKVRNFIPEGEERRPWVYTVADNLLKDLLRKEAARERLSANLCYEPEEVVDFSDPSVLAEQEELTACFVDNYRKLEEPFLTTFRLRYEEGLSYDEIALVTNVPIGTVSSRIRRAKDFCLNYISENDND